MIPIKPENERFTDDQWEAIFYEGKDVLVSASAGSGKTTVLVRRVIEKIKAGTNVDELLIVTYTEAAAKEMKERIEKALQKAINETTSADDQQFLLQQLTLLPTANISTLHSFCLTVIRKYYYLLDLDPSFRMMTDETEQLMLKEDVWNSIRDAHFEAGDMQFERLTDQFASDRNDDALGQVVQELFTFVRSHPNPDQWLAQMVDAYHTADSLGDHPLFKDYVKPQILSDIQQVMQLSEAALALLNQDDKSLKTIRNNAKVNQEWLQTIQSLAETNQWEALYQFIQNEPLKRMTLTKAVKEFLADEVEEVSAFYNALKTLRESLIKDYFALSPETQLQLMQQCLPIVEALAQVIAEFMTAYANEKVARGVMDFSDLEHYTYAILQAQNEEGQYPARLFYQSQFKELLIDEYQDINPLQEELLSLISRPKGNRFMVGDVKQSIYSFRLADPSLFIDKYNRYADDKDGHRIILAENFRSRKHVLSLTNFIFKQLMNESVGQMDYDQNAELVQGYQSYPDEDNVFTEVLIYERDTDESHDIEDGEEGQIRLVATKIKALMKEGYQVFDKSNNCYRPLKYGDIAILAPTKTQNIQLKEIFNEYQLPLVMTGAEDYFQATEVQQMVSLLHLIDNPYQDIHLVTVLRSPLVGLDEVELASLRAIDKSLPFFEVVQKSLRDEKWAAHYPETQSKLAHFMQLLENWRQQARQMKIADLIWQIYQETGFLDYVGGLINGEQRQLNLHALYQRAEQYEQMSFKGLFQFVRLIELMQSRQQDLAEPMKESEDQDAIQVMTIHASKGLEFPVVFCLNFTKRFNEQDLMRSYVFDNHLGFGMRYMDEQRRIAPTLPYTVIRQAKKAKMRAEEMRKLYVALTRAEEKLYLVGHYDNQEKTMETWQADATNHQWVLADQHRLKAKSLMDWIGLSLMRHQCMDEVNQSVAVVTDVAIQKAPTQFAVHFFTEADLMAAPLATGKAKVDAAAEVDTEQLAQLKTLLNFQYPHLNATMTTGYQSVSEIKSVFSDPDLMEMDYLGTVDQRKSIQQMQSDQFRHLNAELKAPKFMQQVEETATGAEVGQATHLLFQLMPLNQTPTVSSMRNLLEQQVQKGTITAAAARFVPLKKMMAFFNHSFGKRLLKDHVLVHREQAFSLLMNPQRLFSDFDGTNQERILIHGIIDGFIEYENAIVLYDFKTNHPQKEETSEQFRERMCQEYRGQLYLYRTALENAFHKPVTESYLILLHDEPLLIDFKDDNHED